MRYLSFRFDDGFFVGAQKVDALLDPDRASFFVEGRGIPDIAYFRDGNFGSPQAWRELAAKGYDDWFVDADADEWLVSPAESQTLLEGIEAADRSG